MNWKRVTLFLICLSVLRAELPELTEAQARFEEHLEALEAERLARLETLSQAYGEALQRLEAQVRQSGALEALLEVRQEIARVAETLESAPDAAQYAPLAGLQQTLAGSLQQVRTAHEARVRQLVTRAQEASRQASSQVLRLGDLEQAIAWRNWGDSLQEHLMPDVQPEAVRLSPAIQVRSARYGARNRWLDVTEQVRQALHAERGLAIPLISNDWAGSDPAHGHPKTLEVTFEIRGRTWTVTGEEGRALRRSVAELHESARGLLSP